MRKIELAIPEIEKIDINGDIFEIRRSDADILDKCADLHKKYERLKKEDVDSVKTAVNKTVSLIDDILGDGAVKKISKGRPVSMVTACKWLMAICGEINKINDDYIKNKYE